MARTGQFRVFITKPNDGETVRKVIAAIASHKPTAAHPLEVIVRPQVKVWSREQLGYYWAVVREIASQTGHDADDLDELFCRLFVGTRDVVIGQEVCKRPRSKSELDQRGMSKLIDDVKHWAGLHLDIAFEEEASA